MKAWILCASALLVPSFATAAPNAIPLEQAAGQQPAPNTNPDNRPEIKEATDKLSEHIGKRGKEDDAAIKVIDTLVQEFEKSGPKDRVLIVKGLDKCFDAKRQDVSEGVPDNKLYMAAAVSLRTMAPESAAVLMKWIGQKDHRKDLALQAKLITSLGKTRDEEGRKVLIKLLVDKSPAVQAATAEALGEFADADQKVRKECVEEMIKNALMPAKGAIDVQQPNQADKDRWDTISAPIITSLQRLSKHNETDPQKWQAWWNDNKKKDWDKS
ncbi:MAG TPA: HEAT repeat domain-containing protein [Planctomycetota bacterium]|nr:HEAT repeat domain-containing protein [Planctomycetota bacterium]